MIVERYKVKVHVFNAIIFQNALLLDQLAQIQIAQDTRLGQREKLVVVEGRLVTFLIDHRVVLDDVVCHSELTLVITHVQRFLLSRHHVCRGRDARTVLAIRRAGHILRSVQRHISVFLILQLDVRVGRSHRALLLESTGLTTSCTLLV